MVRVQLRVLGSVWMIGLLASGCGGRAADTPERTIREVADGLRQNQPQVLWEALPPSYQSDITGLVHLFAEKMDPTVYDKGITLARKLIHVLRDKKDFILGSDMADQAPVDLTKAEGSWDKVLAINEELLESEIGSLEKLRTIDVGRFLSRTGTRMMELGAEVSSFSEEDPYKNEFLHDVENMTVEVISSEGDVSKVRISIPEKEPEEVDFVKVEGKWIPKDMADGWDEGIAEARASLEGLDISEQKGQILMVMGGIEALLDHIASAETQEEFETAVMQGLMSMQGSW